MGIKEEFQRFIAPIKRSISLILGRALLSAVNDTNNIQLVKVTLFADEVKENVEHIQPYGFTSVPNAGAEVLMGFIGGRKEQAIAIVIGDSRQRIHNMSTGDVALHREAGENIWIKLRANEILELHARRVNINLETGGQLNVAGGNLTVDA